MTPAHIPFHMELPLSAHSIVNELSKASKEIFVVGGAVRDAYLGVAPKDIDFATNATPDEIIFCLRRTPGVRTILDIGKSFGVIKVVMEDGNEYELATFRTDIGMGRRPEAVEFTSIENDVKRRDLTINALFYNHLEQKIVDYVGGIEDMKNRVIRTVGNPALRFEEDRLRVLRAVRFAERFGYELHPETKEAILNNNSLSGVSSERIREEFFRCVSSAKNVTHLLETIHELGLWSEIFPGVEVTFGSSGCRNTTIQVALLLRSNEPRELLKSLNRMKYSAEEVAQIAFLVSLRTLSVETAYKLRKNMEFCHIQPEVVVGFAEMNNLVNFSLVGPFCQFKFTVSGEQVMAEGFRGSAIGKELERRETENFRKLVM